MRPGLVALAAVLIGLSGGSALARSEDPLLSGVEAARRGDFTTAYGLWAPLARTGNAEAAHFLSMLYATGQGVARDDAEAVRWVRIAAEAGHVEAQRKLGQFYHLGRGVDPDEAEATRWMRRAAEAGHPEAAGHLGMQYYLGRGVARDPDAARHWFRVAARRGVAEGMHNLGVVYGNGDGVAPDLTRSHMWFSLAASAGHEGAAGSAAGLVQDMNPEQITRATEMADRCRASDYQDCD